MGLFQISDLSVFFFFFFFLFLWGLDVLFLEPKVWWWVVLEMLHCWFWIMIVVFTWIESCCMVKLLVFLFGNLVVKCDVGLCCWELEASFLL